MLQLRRDRVKKPGIRLFWPDFMAPSVEEIDYSILQKQGIKGLFVDLDGTVVARGQYEVSQSVADALKKQPLKVFIATNRPKSRELKDLKERLNANGVIHPHSVFGKPSKRYYRGALKEAGFQAKEVAMIGDRYLQDVFGANRAGLWTVAVNKLDTPTNRFDYLLSTTERWFGNRIGRSNYRKVSD